LLSIRFEQSATVAQEEATEGLNDVDRLRLMQEEGGQEILKEQEERYQVGLIKASCIVYHFGFSCRCNLKPACDFPS
jgi:hypothetical protein